MWWRGSDVRCTIRGEVVARYVNGYITWRLFFACIKKENVCGGSIGKTIHEQEQEQDRRQQDMKPMKPTLVWEELGKGKSTLTEQILQRTHPKKRMLGIHTEVAT